MTTLLNTSDWHVNVSTGGFRRFEDITRSVRETAEIAVQDRHDYYLFTGDLHDPDANGDGYLYSRFLIETAIYVMERGVKFIAIPGNHDVVENGRGTTTLSALAALMGSHQYGERLYVVEEPGLISLPDAEFIALPFTSHDRNYDPAQAIRDCTNLMRSSKLPVIVAGHLNIEGIEIGSETTDFPRGRDIFFPQQACDDLAATGREVFKVNGHYHKAQTFEGIHVPGAVARLTFGKEEEYTPGFQVIEV